MKRLMLFALSTLSFVSVAHSEPEVSSGFVTVPVNGWARPAIITIKGNSALPLDNISDNFCLYNDKKYSIGAVFQNKICTVQKDEKDKIANPPYWESQPTVGCKQ